MTAAKSTCANCQWRRDMKSETMVNQVTTICMLNPPVSTVNPVQTPQGIILQSGFSYPVIAVADEQYCSKWQAEPPRLATA